MTKPNKTANPTAPRHLTAESRVWWRSVILDFELEPHHVKILTAAAEAWDRLQEARRALAKHGTTYVDRFDAPRLRPEVAIERDSRLGFARLVRELGLDTAPEAPRPPALRSNNGGRR